MLESDLSETCILDGVQSHVAKSEVPHYHYIGYQINIARVLGYMWCSVISYQTALQMLKCLTIIYSMLYRLIVTLEVLN